ncbi:MAG: DUF1080 domain-containing protein [Kiritimatiellaeota bacterium]|nr:DUF1080 domain-containing protein [Kiritimatiellota bacterium]
MKTFALCISEMFVAGASSASEDAGWEVLFDGSELTKWQFKPDGWTVEAGTMALKPGGGYIWTREQFGDFVLDLEFKLAEKSNSGVFIRTADIRNPVQTGIEIQLLDTFGKVPPDKHDCGAVYDCLAPTQDAVKAPGEWNRMVITCRGSRIAVVLNEKPIIDMDLDRWIEPRRNPDGSENKFQTAFKDMPRRGHIGFQDHGDPVWFRNVRIKQLEACCCAHSS